MSSYTRQQLENWLKSIHVVADRVLDIGGSQNPIKGRTKSFDVNDWKVLDLENPHETKIMPHFVHDMNLPINEISPVAQEKFDTIFCLEVMEYLWNPFQALVTIRYLLNKDGLLYISFPFIYPHHNPEGKDFLRYTRWGVEKLLFTAGFEIEELVPRKEFDLVTMDNGIEFMTIMQWFMSQGMRPSKQYDGHDEVGYLVKARKKE